jgi:hypothetical protein
MPAAAIQMVRECRISDASSNTDQMQAQAAGLWITPGSRQLIVPDPGETML